MWGQDWGEMIWGSAVTVPSVGGAGAILLVGVLLGIGLSRVRRVPGWLAVVVAFAFVAAPVIGVAAGVEIPYFFSNGTVADAEEINTNFQALQTDSEDQDARLGQLESRGAIEYFGCIWTACVDSPQFSFCPAGHVMVGIDVPEFGGDQGSCNTNSVSGADDYRIRCCQLRVTE